MLAPTGTRRGRASGSSILVLLAIVALLPTLAGCTSSAGSAPTKGGAVSGGGSAPVGNGTGGSATSSERAGGPAGPTATPLAPTPSVAPTPTPSPPPVPAALDGILVPADEAARATRQPLAVMVDDHPDARPQAGLSDADLIYQAPAEGGIPRYMLVYQAGDAPSIGPVRSARRYFLGWAAEWRALYAHVGGAPNALGYLHQVNGSLLWDADEYSWPTYLWRITQRVAPHNVYTSTARLRELAARLGATATVNQPAWTFKDDAPYGERPIGGRITVPYPWNEVSYRYDRGSNRYPRYVSGGQPQIDAGTNRQVAPADVIVQFVSVGPLVNAPGQATNQAKGRLELGYVGSGSALVFRDGVEIPARWSKASDGEPTTFTYATGPRAGEPIPLVRGQIAIQVVPIGTKVSVTPGTIQAPMLTPR